MNRFEFNDRKLRLLIMLAMLVVILAGVKAAADIVVPFLLAVFLAIVLNPLIALLERCRVPRGVGVMLIVMAIVVILFTFISMLASSLNEFARTLPQYRGIMLEKLHELQYYAERFNIDLTFSADAIVKLVDPGTTMNLVTRLLSQLSGVMTSVFLLMMTVVFMLFEVKVLPYKLQQALDKPKEGMVTIKRALKGVTHYLVIKTMFSLVTGLIVWGFLSWIGVRFAFIWGMMAVMFNYIPNIGSVIAAIPPLIQALLFNGFADAMAVAGGYILINLIIGNMVEPRIMGRGLGLSTLVVFLSLIFWGWLMGPVGMLLSVPLTMIARISLETMDGGYKVAVILGDGQVKKETSAE